MRLGVDLGSTAIKAALLDDAGNLLAGKAVPTGGNPAQTAQTLAMELAGGVLPERVVATGYGRALLAFAPRKITEITCHAAGVRHLHPDACSIVDIGGQDSKAIRLDDRGAVADFAMNDKCAAGTGSFFDALARRFSLERDTMSALALQAKQAHAISATCVVFAESEIVGLLGEGAALEDVLAGVYAAVAQRVSRLFTQAGCYAPVYFSGGVAKDPAMQAALEKELGIPVQPAAPAQLMGAIGAAVLA